MCVESTGTWGGSCIYSQTSFTRTHPLWIKLEIKQRNWVNEGAVV